MANSIESNVALGTARCNVEQDSLSDFCYMLNKKIGSVPTTHEGWLGKYIKTKVLTLQLAYLPEKKIQAFSLHSVLATSQYLFGSWFLALRTYIKSSFEKPAKAVSNQSGCRCISSASHEGKLLERTTDEGIGSLNFLISEENRMASEKVVPPWTIYSNWYTSWNWKLK